MDRDAIVVIGGGGHAKVVISILRKLPSYDVLGYTDVEDRGAILDVPYLGADDQIASLSARPGGLLAAVGVGQVGLGHSRQALWTRLTSGDLGFPPIVSPRAVLNEGVAVGPATAVMDGAVVNSGAVLGTGVIANTNCTVEHDVTVGDWVHVAPGVTISGGAAIGRSTMIGAGATVIEGITIADDCVIGAGATVVKDILQPGVYVGCPARRIRAD